MEMIKMDGEMKRVLFVWTTALTSLLACRKISNLIPPGTTRLCVFLPVVAIFLYLPLLFTSVHFSGTTSFFLAWLANFKLLLFAFDNGPLSSHLPLHNFILIASLPIKIITTQNSNKPIIRYPLIKFMLFLFLLKLYQYSHYFHPLLKMTFFSIHMYVVLDLGIAMLAYMARAVVGVHLQPHFNEPYLATSLQDFWGKRWNLLVTTILHPTVYLPVRSLSRRFLTNHLAPFPAVLATFVVSGLMHELIFYYIVRLNPTWEVTWFFILHGVLTGAEVVVKRALAGRFRLPGLVSGGLTYGLVISTSFWLFFPPLLRGDMEVRSCKESMAFVELVVRRRFVAPDDVTCPYF